MRLAVIASFLKRHRFWVAVFVFLLMFFALVPTTGDDYTFLAFRNGLHSANDYIAASSYMYQNLNGRVAGNMSELILIGSYLPSVLVRTIVVFVLMVLVVRLLNIQSKTLRNLTVLAMFCMPIGIFHQTYSWSAGFYNYVTPVMVLAVIVWATARFAAARHNTLRYGLIGALLLLSVLEGLFVENMTLGWVVTAVVGVAAAALKFKGYLLPAVAALTGAIIGAAIMFGSPVYQRIAASSGDGYRQISTDTGGILKTVKDNMVAFSDYFISDYTILPIFLSVVGLFLVYSGRTKLPARIKRFNAPLLKNALVVALIACPAYFIASNDFTNMKMLPGYAYNLYAAADFLVAMLYVVSLVGVYLLYVRDTRVRYVASGLLLASVVYTAPLLAVNPFGGRNFYVSYLFMILAGLIVAWYAFGGFVRKYEQLSLRRVSQIGLLSAAVVYLGIFSVISIHHVKNDKLATIQMSEGKSDIVLKKYPFNRFIQDADNSKKATRVYAECYCTYALCRGCSDIVVRYE